MKVSEFQIILDNRAVTILSEVGEVKEDLFRLTEIGLQLAA